MKKKKADAWALDPALTNLVVTHSQAVKNKMRVMKYKDTDKFLGFVVFGGGSGKVAGAPTVRPIYDAVLHLQPAGGKDADTRYTFPTYEVGERLSGYSYAEDPDGVILATIASMAIGYLQQRTESARRAYDKGLARDVEAFKQLASTLGIKPPKKKSTARFVETTFETPQGEGTKYVRERLREAALKKRKPRVARR